MSRRPVHPRTYTQIALFLAVLVAIAVTVRTVRATAPEVTLPPVTTAAPDREDPEVVTCERTLPEAPESEEEVAEVDPVGRVFSVDVIECPDAFERQPIIYMGEVIGDVLQRDGGAWVLVNDDPYALEVGPLQGHSRFEGGNSGLSVWLQAPLPELEPGGPDRRGTIIEVQGRVLRSDPADGGGLTVRAFDADSTTIVAEATPIDKPVNRGQAVAAVVLLLAAVAVVIAERRAAAIR